MADNAPRPPVAVRIVRPYETEEAFLESELETVGKTSVILIGAHARPTGVILRFELTLQNGNVVLRGEGRVLAHKDSAFRGQPGLALRFTRLDPKSKALVDRAAAIREARLSGSIPPQPVPTPAESSSAPIVDSAPSAPSTPPAPPSEPQPSSSARTTPPGAPSSPPTAPPTAPPSQPPAPPLVAMPSFAPLAVPSNIPSAPPANPNATIAPDAMLAHILTAPTPAPPPATTAPPGEHDPIPEEAKTRPGKRAELLALAPEEPEPAPNPHATTTVAAPALASAPEPTPAPPPPPTRVPAPSINENSAVTRVADRDAILARLRERRASMSDQDKDDILRKR